MGYYAEGEIEIYATEETAIIMELLSDELNRARVRQRVGTTCWRYAAPPATLGHGEGHLRCVRNGAYTALGTVWGTFVTPSGRGHVAQSEDGFGANAHTYPYLLPNSTAR